MIAVTITVIDDTRPKVLPAGSLEVRSVGPGAFARIPELERNGITQADWQDATLDFNGRSWTVRSYELRGSPNGEDSGEVRFLMKEKPDGSPAAPGNTALPVISGTTQDGHVLTTTNGTWNGPPASAYAYQWRRDGVDIGGATAATYTLVTADVGAMMTVAVTATNAKGSGTAIAAGVGPVTAAAAVSGDGFNGGRSQINMPGIRHYGDYPFINLVKSSDGFGNAAVSGAPPADPDILDRDGYPTSGGPWDLLIYRPRAADRPGEYVLKWDGNGSFADWTGSGITGGSLTSTTGSGSCKGTPYADVQFTLRISSTSAAPDNVRNVRFYHVDDQVDFETNGEIFGKKLRDRLAEARFGVIRFLDWQVNNTNHSAKWADVKPLTHYSYYAGEFRGAAWGADKWYFGATTNSGNNYSITTTRGRAPVHGDVIQLYFNASATKSGTCSLNVDGSGAVNILDAYGQALSTGGNSYPEQWAYGTTGRRNYATLVYVSSVPAWVKQGGDLASPESGMWGGTPPQMAMQLAARVGAHPWLLAPIHSMNPYTDYVTGMASYCRDNAPSWMVPRYEPPNESFNNFGGFYSNGNIRAISTAYGWPASGPEDYVHVYGKFASVMGQDLDAIYGHDRSKYVFLVSVQTALGSSSTSNTANILTSAMYVSQAAPPQSGFIKAPASNYVHGIACANYYGPSVQDTPTEATMAHAYALGDASQVPLYISKCYDASPGYTLPRNQADFTGYKAMAQANSVQIMEFYEGGFSPDYVGGDTEGNNFKSACKYHIDLKQVSVDDYAICTGISGGGFTARFPSHYFLSDNKWIHGGTSATVWSLLDDVYETPESAQWQAIVAYNSASE